MTTRFILENMAAAVMGGVFPPYFPGFKPGVARPKVYDDIQRMDDEELTATIRNNALGMPMVFPLEMRRQDDTSDYWVFPLEPLISISGRNTIVKRNVAKKTYRGTVKEYWSQDDYSITISGLLMDLENIDRYPEEDVDRLREFCEAQVAIDVKCHLFTVFQIARLVIDDWDIPFTKGANTQAYTLKCSSDDLYNLLVEETIQNS